MGASQENESITLRDPDATLFRLEDEYVRLVKPDTANFFKSLAFESVTFGKAGRLIDAAEISANDRVRRDIKPPAGFEEATWFRHPALSFINYPYEWAPNMLRDAAHLTLEIAADVLAKGGGLKDATPYNIVFDQGKPVFVDIGSFQKREPTDPLWKAEAQFVRLFLAPLLANRDAGIPLRDSLLANADGLSPEKLYALTPWLRRLTPTYLRRVTIPVWLSSRSEKSVEASLSYQMANEEKANFVLRSLLKGLTKDIDRACGSQHHSTWSNYTTELPSYDKASKKEKTESVTAVLKRLNPAHVLDLGCNTGEYSQIAASLGASVVAVDSDEMSIQRLYEQIKVTGQRITPMVVDLTNPTPALGWENAERFSFLERARQKFDCVMALALMHHVVVRGGIPLNKFLQLLHGTTRYAVLLEYIGPKDPMFRKLARGRDLTYDDVQFDAFMGAVGKLFSKLDVVSRDVGDDRALVLACK